MEIKIKKSELRKEMKQKRNLLSKESIQKAEKFLWNSLENHPVFQKSKVVYLYLSYQKEVPTWGLLKECLKAGKAVALPKVLDHEHMEFYYISSIEQLEKSNQGIFEPGEFCSMAKEPGIMFLPGLAFDKEMHRMGYGGGYYDRYLNRMKSENYYKIGLAYDFQVLEQIDTESHDESLNEVITVLFSSYR